MSRSGYTDDCENLNLYRNTVDRAIKGKRGQKFLKELAQAMDDMQEKILISDELINKDGDCCAIGVICKSHNLDISKVDYYEADQVGKLVNISRSMAAEIEYENDEGNWDTWSILETPEKRWVRMRKWVDASII